MHYRYDNDMKSTSASRKYAVKATKMFVGRSSAPTYRRFIPDARPITSSQAGRGSFWYRIWATRAA